jgi:hypothetical protein
MAVVINYGRVFRVKNALISHIEQEEGITTPEDITGIIQKANSLGYNYDIDVCYTEGKTNTKYYSVKLYIKFQIPLMNNDNTEMFDIPISGETSAIRDIDGVVTEPSVNHCSQGYQRIRD